MPNPTDPTPPTALALPSTPTLLALPAPPHPTAHAKRRILVLARNDGPPDPATARLIAALEALGAEIHHAPLVAPPATAEAPTASALSEITREIGSFARDMLRGLRGNRAATDPHTPTPTDPLHAVHGALDAILTTDSELARAAFATCETLFPGVPRIGVDGDYHIDDAWKSAALDALVTAHPALDGDLPRLRDGQARLYMGGPLAPGPEVAPRTVGTGAQVVISLQRLDPADVDPLLFQLTLAQPDRLSLLVLPSTRPGIDELVRARAANYGLQAKRPKAGSDVSPFIRGAAVLIGLPSSEELATAVTAGVPLLLIGGDSALSSGDRFLLEHGAIRSEVPLTIAVQLESILPGGPARDRAIAALADLDPSGATGAAHAVYAAIAAGRPQPVSPGAAAAAPQPATGDDDLEDLGAPPPAGAAQVAADVPLALRRAYLKEIILQLHDLTAKLGRARAGLDTWQRRVRLARSAREDALADRAIPRVEGLMRVITQLETQERELRALRERFAGSGPLTQADRAQATRFFSPSTAASLDRGEAPDSAFTRLELDDALANLKRKLGSL